MNDKKWAYKSRWRKSKAVFFTLLFHLALLAGISLAQGNGLEAFLPDFVLEWLYPDGPAVGDYVKEIRP